MDFSQLLMRASITYRSYLITKMVQDIGPKN